VAGIPLRQELYTVYTPEEVAAIKQRRGIDPEAKVVLAMSGGGGQESPFPELLLNSTPNGTKYHMIVIAGANNRAGDVLNAHKKEGNRFITGKNPDITLEVAEDASVQTAERKYFVGPKMLSELFAIADCGFSKPGGVSMFEFFQTGVPVIADRRQEPLEWEDFNIRVIQNKGRGIIYSGQEDFLGTIDRAIALEKKPKENLTERIAGEMQKLLALRAAAINGETPMNELAPKEDKE
jgi:UDP-N-acetylglucosamine:LPS N-acetylglucosamine transferase